MTSRKIRQIRKRLGLSQQDFARRLGVARVTVTRWENGSRRPSRIADLAVRTTLQAKKTHGWQEAGATAFNELWDNREDAIYDDWKARYGPQAR